MNMFGFTISLLSYIIVKLLNDCEYIKSYMWTAVKDVDMKAIFAVMDTSWAVVKISPKKKSDLYC